MENNEHLEPEEAKNKENLKGYSLQKWPVEEKEFEQPTFFEIGRKF